MSQGLLVKRVLEWFDYEVVLRLLMDSSAGRAILRREGVGKIKHLSTRVLWTQQVVKRRDAAVGTVLGDENIADLGTKPLAGPRLKEQRWACGLRPPTSSVAAALKCRCLVLVSAAAVGNCKIEGDEATATGPWSAGDFVMLLATMLVMLVAGLSFGAGVRLTKAFGDVRGKPAGERSKQPAAAAGERSSGSKQAATAEPVQDESEIYKKKPVTKQFREIGVNTDYVVQKKAETRSVLVQGPVGYSKWRKQPRFYPHSEVEWGAWGW